TTTMSPLMMEDAPPSVSAGSPWTTTYSPSTGMGDPASLYTSASWATMLRSCTWEVTSLAYRSAPTTMATSPPTTPVPGALDAPAAAVPPRRADTSVPVPSETSDSTLTVDAAPVVPDVMTS